MHIARAVRAGQPFIIENKPGATAMVGTAIVKNAPTDGYTLLHGSTSSLAANPSLYRQMTYDPDEFTTVAIDGTIPCFMLAAKDAPYNSVKEFVAWAKARKEPIFSGYGNTSSRVPSALFDVQSGVRLEEVAYKDAVPGDPGPDRRAHPRHLSRPRDRRELRALGPGEGARRDLAAARAAIPRP